MFSSAVQGMSASLQTVSNEARKITNSENVDLPQAEVSMMTAEAALKADLAFFRASNQMTQSIIDVLA